MDHLCFCRKLSRSSMTLRRPGHLSRPTTRKLKCPIHVAGGIFECSRESRGLLSKGWGVVQTSEIFRDIIYYKYYIIIYIYRLNSGLTLDRFPWHGQSPFPHQVSSVDLQTPSPKQAGRPHAKPKPLDIT